MSVSIRYQVLVTRRMSTYGSCTTLRHAWTFCNRQRYDAMRHKQHTAGFARKLIIERGKKTLIVKG